MRPPLKPIKRPEHFTILDEDTRVNHHRVTKVFKLRYNSQLFEKAACAGLDTDLFYPDKNIFTPAEERVFENLCIECPIMMACLEWGLVHEREGIWGGMTPARRQGLRQRLNWMVSDPDHKL